MATRAGFLAFVRDVMGIPSAELPDNSLTMVAAYDVSIETVNLYLEGISEILYDQAVYNLGGDYVINWAPNQPNSTFFTDLRKEYKITSFTAGVIQSASDEGTAESLLVADVFKNISLSDLQNMKTPYGRQYLALAMKFGTLWGIS